MHTLERTNRFKRIERRFNTCVSDLLYQMHWVEDMKHRDIALNLHIPRSTATKWFRHFRIPTQSCRRFTDKNLTSWLYKTGRLKKKLRYDGPDRRIQRTKNGLDVDFFKKWSLQMACVLGYFAADGCMYINSGKSKFINFVSTDYELLEKVKKILKSKHKIALKRKATGNWKPTYILQIGSREIYDDLRALGLMPNKEKRLSLPQMPSRYLRHFVRGYFDGDGSITYGHFKRKDRHKKATNYILTCLAAANPIFLRKISKVLEENAGTGRGYLDKKSGHLSYSKLDSIKFFQYIYKNVAKSCYLERKYNKFQKAFKNYRGCGLV